MKKYFLVASVILLALSCQKTERGIPVGSDDTAPAPVSNVKVQNIPGGATISYSLPDSKSLLYVLAEYHIRDTMPMQKKASYYNNSLTVEGFPDTLAHDVTLYAVSRGNKRSEPVTVKIDPLTPPGVSAFQSLQVQPTFGGINVRFVNKARGKIKINVLTTDSLGDWYTRDIFYTELDSGYFSSRGFDSLDRKFAIFVRDRWNNYSDTLFTEVKPFFEQEMDKSKFREVDLPTDTHDQHCCGTGMVNLWDDTWDINQPVFHTKPVAGIPQWFTFDLGVEARLSRFKLYHRLSGNNGAGTDGAYYAGDPKVIEVYGSNDPNPDGSWDSWTLLGHFNSIKPSGEANPTADDIQFACVDGEDFEFPLDNPPVRYLRFKIMDTWGGVSYMFMAELSFWGSLQ